MSSRGSRIRFGGLSAGAVLAILALAVPPLVAAANITVSAIPGAGWIQGPDNNAADAVIAASPAAGLGADSVALTIAANTDFVAIGRPIAQPLSDITAGAWMTFVAGDSGNTDAEPATMKFGMYRLGGASEFTTLVVERFRNGTVTADAWETTNLTASTVVWQTNAAGAFCVQATPCTLADFKTQYPNALVIGLQVGVGTGTGATTSYVDGVSLTIDGVTDTWDFELAAVPTPTPVATPPAGTTGPAATLPPTDVAVAARVTPSRTTDGLAFIILGVATGLALLSVRLRRTRRTS
jgi:hypothetical protein